MGGEIEPVEESGSFPTCTALVSNLFFYSSAIFEYNLGLDIVEVFYI